MADTLNTEEIIEYIRKALSERGLDSLELAEHIAGNLGGELRRSNEFCCPSCGERLQMSMNVVLRRVVTLHSGEKWTKGLERGEELKAFKAKQQLAAEQDERIKALKDGGLYDAFVSAMKQLPGNFQIKQSTIDSHLLTFLEKSNEMRLNDWARTQLLRTFNGTQVQAFSLSSIAAVVIDGITKIFVPTALLKGESISRITASGAEIVSTTEKRTLTTWIRTKHGYVVGNGAMWDELRKNSKGAFTNTGV